MTSQVNALEGVHVAEQQGGQQQQNQSDGKHGDQTHRAIY